MTKTNFTSINVIMDASGSMQHLAADTIGSFNSFLAEQKAVPGEAVFTLCRFNTDYTLIHDFVKLGDVPDLNAKSYAPSGGTALLDAMGVTINSVGEKLASLPEEERPSKVIFLIVTDGEENSSRKFTASQIKDMVTHQQDVYNWTFVFMGANIDAITAGRDLGFTTLNSANYIATAGGTQQLYGSISKNMTSYRGSVDPVKDFFQTSTPTTQVISVPVIITPTTKK